jgi:hypothetical protein
MTKRLEILLATVIFLTVFASSGSGQDSIETKPYGLSSGFRPGVEWISTHGQSGDIWEKIFLESHP